MSTELIVVITDADGNTTTLSSDASDPGDRPRGIQFSSQRGSGFYTGSFSLSRAIDRENIDLNLLDDVRIILANGDTVYEGFITNLPRSTGSDGHTITVELSGYMAATADEPFTMIFVDRDLSRWGSAAVGRNLTLLSTDYTQAAVPSVIPDTTTGRAALSLQTVDEWAAPVKAISEAMYDAGPGNTIGAVYFDPVNVGQADGLNAAWGLYVRTTATDDFAVVNGDTGDLWGTVLPTGFLVDPAPVRYAVISFFYNGSPGGASGHVYSVQMRDLAVYGNVDLINQTGEQPYGVNASDVIRYLIDTYCPLLNTAGVQDTTYPIRQLAFTEPTTVYDALLKVNSYHLWSLAVWENRTLHFEPFDTSSWDWEVRSDEVGNVIGLQGDSATELRNGIIVQYTDVATGHSDRLHPDDHPELRDTAIDNPYNRHGRKKYEPAYTIPFPTTTANALELGRIKMAEDNAVRAPGSFTVGPWIRDRAGVLQPVSMVRSGQRVRLTSSVSLSDRARLIGEVSYDHSSMQATISVDSTSQYLEGLIDRTTTALAAYGLS